MATTPAFKRLKVVLTGGPCAGKTTIADILGLSYPDRLQVVPESASVLLRGGFPRWSEATSRAAFQAAVYQVQLQAEKNFECHYGESLLLLDRGTVDGAAYWPEGPESFFKAMQTSESEELARYDQVIYLESASRSDYEQFKEINPTRSENWDEAHELDETTRKIWSRHPNVAFVPNDPKFTNKVNTVLHLIERCLSTFGTKR